MVSAKLSPGNPTAKIAIETEVSDAFIGKFDTEPPWSEESTGKATFEEAQKVNRSVYAALRRLSRTLRFVYHSDANFRKFKLQWVGPSGKSRPLPGRGAIVLGGGRSVLRIEAADEPLLAKALGNGYSPLLAWDHWERADEDVSPRYKWIDATIAAELGIKEFLIERVPSMATYVLNAPSPPLDLLYGPVLREVLGEASPSADVMQRGNRVRNDLLHKPTEKEVDMQESETYAARVAIALDHLEAHRLLSVAPRGKAGETAFNRVVSQNVIQHWRETKLVRVKDREPPASTGAQARK